MLRRRRYRRYSAPLKRATGPRLLLHHLIYSFTLVSLQMHDVMPFSFRLARINAAQHEMAYRGRRSPARLRH